MKKFLSILIAISLIISMIPAAFAAGETVTTSHVETYAFNYSAIGLSEVTLLSKIDGTAIDGEGNNIYEKYGWKYFDMSDALLAKESTISKKNVGAVGSSTNGIVFSIASAGAGVDLSFSLSLKAPSDSGFYYPKLVWYTGSGSQTLKWYMSEKMIGNDNVEDYVNDDFLIMNKTGLSTGDYEDKSSYEQYEYPSLCSDVAVYLSSNKEIVTAFASAKKNYKFKAVTLMPILGPDMTTVIKNDDDTTASALTLNLVNNKQQTVTLHTTVTGTTDGTNSVTMPVSNNFITYKSSNEAVATVAADGTITAVGGGTATIYAESSDKKYNSLNNGIAVTVTTPVVPDEPGEAVTDTTVSVAVQSENTDEGTVSWDGETVGAVNMGDTVTATATANEGYVFKFWKNASDQVLSDKASESFVINTNSAITAVFDKVDDTADTFSVELYNANGMPFDNKTVNKETTFAEAIEGVKTPIYTGFGTFKHWSMYADESKIADDMLITKNTRAVAIFNESTEKYTVSVNGTPMHSDVLYGKEVTVSSTASDFSYWKLGEKIVSYNPNYKFTVWGEVDLTEVTGESVTAAPVAVLDEVDGNPLLIYSVPTGCSVVEAGILFGSTKNINIYSVDGSRAAAARGTGQFTAQPKESDKAVARGYLIFKNTSGEIRILYAD